MKISIVCGPLLPVPPVRGGSSARIWQGLAEEFVKSGHEVNLHAKNFPGQPKSENIAGVNYFRNGGFEQSKNSIWNLIRDFKYALETKSLLHEADILIISDVCLPMLLRYPNKLGHPILPVARHPKGHYKLYPAHGTYVPLSQGTKEGLQEVRPELAVDSTTIGYPLDLSVFTPSKENRASAQTDFIYIGRIHEEKGLKILIEAFRSFAEQEKSTLRILGPYLEKDGGSGEAYLSELKELGAGLPLSFEEPIFKLEELASAYRSADVFIYPSLAETGETFGLAALEAMACGVPTIVSDLACFKDFIVPGKNGAIFNHRESNASDNLYREMAKLLADKDSLIKLKAAGVETAARYSYRSIADQYLKLFNTLL